MAPSPMAVSDNSPVLLFAWGNPSRGDDALGPEFIARLEERGGRHDVDTLTDYQLQIEHALDLHQRELILFVDACLGNQPFAFETVVPVRDNSFTSHALSPQALLSIYEEVYGQPPPPAFLLRISGCSFQLGSPLSDTAQENLRQAVAFAGVLLDNSREAFWRKRLQAGL